MRHIVTIYRWELQRIFSNWRKTATLFLLPAVILTIALNIFPLLMNYLSTGSFVSRPIIIVNAPDSFKQYLDENIDANVFSYEFWSSNRLTQVTKEEGLHNVVKNGTVVCTFWSGEKNTDFDKKISEYYDELYSGAHVESNAVVYVAYSASSMGGQALAEQFKQGVLDKYQDGLITILGKEYSQIGSDLFSIDSFKHTGKVVLLENSRVNRRTFLNNYDSCSAVLALAHTDSALDGTIYNVATDEEISIIDLARLCAEKMGIENPVIEFSGYRASDPERRLLNTDKIRSRTSWAPKVDLARGLDECIRNYLAEDRA